jgi:hypothetical protein
VKRALTIAGLLAAPAAASLQLGPHEISIVRLKTERACARALSGAVATKLADLRRRQIAPETHRAPASASLRWSNDGAGITRVDFRCDGRELFRSDYTVMPNSLPAPR